MAADAQERCPERGQWIHAIDDFTAARLLHEDREAQYSLVKTTNRFRFSCRLTSHVAWKESALAFVCHTIPTPIGSSVWRKGSSISGTWRRLVVAAIRVSTAISIRRDRVVGVRVMNTRVCHGGWRNTDSERHDECAPGLGHHDEFLLKSAQLQRLSDWPE